MLSDLINMLVRTNLVGCCFALLTALLAGLPLQAEEAVKAMTFYEEPLATPGQRAGTPDAKRSFAMIFVFGTLVVAALFLLIVRSRGGRSTR